MTIALMSGLIAAIGAMGSVFTIASALRRDSFPHTYSPPRRVAFATGLFAIASIAGIVAVQQATRPATRSSPVFASNGPARPTPEATQRRQPEILTTTDAPITSVTMITTNSKRISGRPPSPRALIRIYDDAGNLMAELVAIAEHSVGARVSVEGNLHTTTSAPDANLQGLVTAYARLTITIADAERITDAFELQTKGGGFTTDAAVLQAHTRLADALRNRLREQR